MAGPIYQRQHTLIFGADALGINRQVFYNTTLLLESSSYYQRIASNWGLGAAASNFSGSGEKAFGVWRSVSSSEPHDIFLCWCYNSASNVKAGSEPTWSILNTNFGVAIAVGWHSSSVAWNGTTNNNGADTFGDAFFKSHSVVFPYANGAAQTATVATRNAATPFYDGTDTSLRMYGAADYDGFCLFLSGVAGGGFDTQLVFDRYTPITSSYDLPYIFSVGYAANRGFPKETALGAANSGLSRVKVNEFRLTNNGYGPTELPYFQYGSLNLDSNFITFPRGAGQANGAITDEYPIIVTTYQGEALPVGHMNFVRLVNAAHPDRARIGSGSRFVMTDSSAPGTKFTMPFTASINPGGTLFTGSVFYNTAAFSGGLPYTLPNSAYSLLTTIISGSGSSTSTDLWRYFLAGNYFFSTTYPAGQTDIVKVR